ncbi:MAG: MCE family protein [Pedosphaera sp.]|nr:MCE family protein [Pedosphaera sp.]
MNSNRYEWRVGFFVILGLALTVFLAMRFSKGSWAWEKSYPLRLTTSNAGAIRGNSSVIMAGVKIGWVREITLDVTGKSVTIHLGIQERYPILDGAIFRIESAGFLGDQNIAVYPGDGKGKRLAPNAEVQGKSPFNLEATAETAQSMLANINSLIQRLDGVVLRLDRDLLSMQTVSNLNSTIANFNGISGEIKGFTAQMNSIGLTANQMLNNSMSIVRRMEDIIATNSPAIGATMTNLTRFTEQLNSTSAELQSMLATNKTDIAATLQNVRSATAKAEAILSSIEAGRGVIGGLVKGNELQQRLSEFMTNANNAITGFGTLASNLNKHGLFYSPRNPTAPTTPARSKKPD